MMRDQFPEGPINWQAGDVIADLHEVAGVLGEGADSLQSSNCKLQGAN
jgi:hypothetical protein